MQPVISQTIIARQVTTQFFDGTFKHFSSIKHIKQSYSIPCMSNAIGECYRPKFRTYGLLQGTRDVSSTPGTSTSTSTSTM